MAWFRVKLSEDEQRQVREDRDNHPHPRIRIRMWVLWLLHCGQTRDNAAQICNVSRTTVQRFVAAYQDGGLEGLRQWDVKGPVTEMASFSELLKTEFEQNPPFSAAQAGQRIFELTGIRRQPTQVRAFLKELGLAHRRMRAVPVPPKKVSRNTSKPRPSFTTTP